MSFSIKFLGTGAADRIDILQDDNFDNKDHRRCSAALINGHVLLDCGKHILNSLKVANISHSDITDIFITHLHSDHFDSDAVNKIASAGGVKLWVRADAALPPLENCEIVRMESFCAYSAGELTVTGVPANHEMFAQHFSVECDKKHLFYGLDGAWFLGDTVRFMQNKKYDMFVFDATVGDYTGDYRMGEHNSIPMIRLMIPSMKTLGIIDDTTVTVLSHMAVCLHKSYEETVLLTKNDNITVAYDGLELEI